MLTLFPPTHTLADAYDFLADHGYDIVRTITASQLQDLIQTDPRFNEPTHRIVSLHKDKAKTIPLTLLFSNLGNLYFSNNDTLEDFPLNKPEFYFDYSIPGDSKIHQRHNVVFDKSGHKEWTAQFDYATIFEAFGLDGNDDFAPFVGFYSIM